MWLLASKISVGVSLFITCMYWGSRGWLRIEDLVISQYRASHIAAAGFLAESIGFELIAQEETISALDRLQLEAEMYQISPELIFSIIDAESSFNPSAKSGKGAQGLMQLMPATVKHCGIRDPFNVKDNLSCGIYWVDTMRKEAKGSLIETLELYNGGPKCVGGKCAETRAYVAKVLNGINDPKVWTKAFQKLSTIESL